MASIDRLGRLGSHLQLLSAGAQLPPPAGATAAAAAGDRRPKLALVTTDWFSGTPADGDTAAAHGTPSHSVHMGDRFLTGWPMGGEWHTPGLEVVSAYVDQRPGGRQGPVGKVWSTLPADSDETGRADQCPRPPGAAKRP